MDDPKIREKSIINKITEIKEVVEKRDISLSNLFKYSFKLLSIKPKELIALQLFYALISAIFVIFGSPQHYHLSFHYLVYQIILMLITAFGAMVLTSAARDVYNYGKFHFGNVLVNGFRKVLKYIWTSFLLIFFMIILLVIFMLFTTAMTAFGIPRALPLFIGFIVLIALFIWAIVPLFFLNYIIVCNDYYGLKSIRILFRMVKGQRCRLFWYQIVMGTICLVPIIPIIYLTFAGIRTAYFLNIPLSVIWLYENLYALVLYKHLVAKFGESNLDSFDIYNKWDTILELNEMIRIKPNDAKLHNSRGYIYLDLERYKDAMEDFEKIIELDKKYKDTYVGLAIAYYRMGNKKKAIESYKIAIKLDKRYKRKLDELIKEGYSYTTQNLQTINEILKEINIK